MQVFGRLLLTEELPRVLDEFDIMAWKACAKGIFDEITAELPDE